jgi:hypothetical protein
VIQDSTAVTANQGSPVISLIFLGAILVILILLARRKYHQIHPRPTTFGIRTSQSDERTGSDREM